MKHLLTLILFATVLGPLRAGPSEPHGDPPGGRKGPPAVDRYLRMLEERNPEEYNRMRELREQDPEAFRAELRSKAFQRSDRRRGRSLERHPLSEEIAAYRNADSDEARAAALAALREKTGEFVDRGFERREQAISELREQLRELEARHEQEKANRDEVVEAHLQRLVRRIEQGEDPEDGTPPPTP